MTLHRVARSFSRSFETYHDAADQQAKVAEILVNALRDHGAPARFERGLELGCGTGHLTRRISATFDIDALTLNDIAPCAHDTAVNYSACFLPGDAAKIEWPQRPDLIVSASMIQWLDDPQRFLRRAARALAPGGWLAVSGFGPTQYHELVDIGSSAQAPGLCRPGDLANAIRDELEVLTASEALVPVTFPTPRKVLEHLRQTGVNGRARTVWTKASLSQFTRDYTVRFGDETGVPLTYHPVWIIARKRG